MPQPEVISQLPSWLSAISNFGFAVFIVYWLTTRMENVLRALSENEAAELETLRIIRGQNTQMLGLLYWLCSRLQVAPPPPSTVQTENP